MDLHFIYGIEEYLNWKYDSDDYRNKNIALHKNWFLHDDYYALQKLLLIEIKRGYFDLSEDFVKIIFHKVNNATYLNTRRVFRYICHTIQDSYLQDISKFTIQFSKIDFNDFLSRGQIESKIWLIDTIKMLFKDNNLGNVAVLGCWYNFLGALLFDLFDVKKIRGFDIDPTVTYFSDMLLEKYVHQDWKYKCVNLNVEDLQFKDGMLKYHVTSLSNKIIKEITNFDIFINTSSEHMSDKWIKSIPKDKIIILQTNNMNSLEEHINCCESLDHAVEKYSKYGKIIWAGSKVMITDYERYMIFLKRQ